MRDDRLARSSKCLLIYRLVICYFKWHYFKSEGRVPDLRKWRGPRMVALRLWFYLQDGGEKRLASTWNKVTPLLPYSVLGYTAFQITSEDWTVPEFILVTPSTSVTTAYRILLFRDLEVPATLYVALLWTFQLLFCSRGSSPVELSSSPAVGKWWNGKEDRRRHFLHQFHQLTTFIIHYPFTLPLQA